MKTTVNDVIKLMNSFAPEWLACEGDPVGLHAGKRSATVKRILVALDATDKVIELAKKKKCQMIVTHHPRFYRGLKNLDEDRFMGEIAAALVRSRIALYCAHTNLDIAVGGVNDVLADMCGLRERSPLKRTYTDRMLKLTVFVPESHLQELAEAICDAGAGCIGEYTDCTYRVKGEGTFRPSDSSKPYLGTAGKLEKVEEWRLEAVLPQSSAGAVSDALFAVHPYEEPAYDFTTLRGGQNYGLGRFGKLPRKVKLLALAKKLKKVTGSACTSIIGKKDLSVNRLGVWCGGGVAVSDIARHGLDAVVCGELGYHDAEFFEANGIGAIVLGHAPSEQKALEVIVGNLKEGLADAEIIEAPHDMWPGFVSV